MANRSVGKNNRVILQHVDSVGYVTDLTFGGLTYWSKQVGMGMAPLHRLSEQGPNQDGVTDLGFRLDQRTVGLVLGIVGPTPEIVESKQERLYSLFKPRTSSYSLRLIKVGAGVVRQIDCHTLAGPDFGSDEEVPTINGYMFRAGLQITAPNPVWYDPTLRVQSFGLTGGGGAWTIPWVIPWAIGSSDLNQTSLITYAGNWEEFPIIIVVGPITNAVITNNVSGQSISFQGQTIANGDTYTIDLRPGRKTVVDQNNVNQVSKLADGSDLATFSLLPDPDVPDGINPIQVSGSLVSTVTQVYVQYYRRYIGGR